MTFPGRAMTQGSFLVPTSVSSTVTAVVNVNCGYIPTAVFLQNLTKYATTGGYTQQAWWNSAYPTGTTVQATAFSSTTILSSYLFDTSLSSPSAPKFSTVGIVPYTNQVTPATSNQNSIVLGPVITGSNTNTNGTFTITSTGTLYPGAMVLMTKNSVNKQLSGMYFTVATVATSTTFTIANATWLAGGSFTSGAETFNVQLVTAPPYYYPSMATIVNISQANPAVITTSISMGLTAGQVVRLRVPSAFGMTQANNIVGIVSSTSANQITLGGTTGAFSLNNAVNSSAFTAFAWPAAAAVPFTYASVTPVGSGPQINGPSTFNSDTVDDSTINISYSGFTVGAGILTGNTATSTAPIVAAGDVIAWIAWRADQ